MANETPSGNTPILVMGVDSTQMDKGIQSSDNLAKSYSATIQVIDDFGNIVTLAGTKQAEGIAITEAVTTALQAQQRTVKEVIESEKLAIAVTDESLDASQRFLIKLQQLNETFGYSKTQLLGYQASLLGVSSAAEPLIASLEALQIQATQNAIQQQRDIEIYRVASAEQAAIQAQTEQLDMQYWAQREASRKKDLADYENYISSEINYALLEDARIRQISQARDAEIAARRAADYARQLNEYAQFIAAEIDAALRESARLNQIQQARDAEIHAAQTASYNTQLKEYDNFINTQIEYGLKEEAARQAQLENANAAYVAWWEKTLVTTEAYAERQAILEIKYGEMTLNSRIAQLQALQKYTDNKAISPTTVENTFGKAAIADLPNLNALMSEYNASLSTNAEKLKTTGSEAAAAGKEVEGFAGMNARATNELVVLGREMGRGNYSRMAGSFTVFAQAMNIALGPIAAITVGLGLLAYETIHVASEQEKLAGAFAASNKDISTNIGLTHALSKELNDAGYSMGSIYDATLKLAQSGKFSSDQIGMITTAAVQMERYTGQSVDKTIEEFESMAVRIDTSTNKSSIQISEAAVKVNDKYHFLTMAVFDQINALEREGKQREASSLLMEEYAKVSDRVKEKVIASMSPIQKLWEGVKNSTNEALGAVQRFVSVTPDVQKIINLQNDLEKLGNDPGRTLPNGVNLVQQDRIRILTQIAELQVKVTAASTADAFQQMHDNMVVDASHAKLQLETEDLKHKKDALGDLAVALERNKTLEAQLSSADVTDPLVSAEAVKARHDATVKEYSRSVQDGHAKILQEITNAINDEYKAVTEAGDVEINLAKEAAKAGTLLRQDEYNAVQQNAQAKLTAYEAIHNKEVAELAAYGLKYVKEYESVQEKIQKADQVYNEKKQKVIDDAAVEGVKITDTSVKSSTKDLDTQNKQLDDQIKRQKELNAEIGKTEAQKELARQKQSDDLIQEAELNSLLLEREISIGNLGPVEKAADEARLKALEGLITRQKNYNELLGDAAILSAAAASQKKWDEAWQQSFKKIEDDLTSAIISGGTAGWKKLIKDMELAFARTILQPILAPISGSIASIINPNATQSQQYGGGGAGSAGSAVGAAQAAMSIYSAVSKGFDSIGSVVANSVQQGINTLGPGTGYYTGVPTSGIGNSSLAQGAGTAASYLAAAYAGKQIGSAISGDYGIDGHGSAVVNIGEIVGTILGAGSPIGTAIGGAIGGLVNRLFGTGTPTVSQGIDGYVSNGGSSIEETTTTNTPGGLFRSDSTDTTYTRPDDVVNSFNSGLQQIEAATGTLAKNLGLSTEAFANYGKEFNLALTTDAAANQKTISDFFVGIGDDLATRLIPNIADFALVGEDAATTLQRLSDTFAATNNIANMLGRTIDNTFGSSGVASDAARERLVGLAGGLSNLVSEVSNYNDTFLTEAEKIRPVAESVATAMDQLGYANVTTRAQFKDIVDGLDLTKQSSAELFQNLMALAPAFAQVHQDLTTTVTLASATSDLTQAYNTQSSALKSTIQTMHAYNVSITQFRDSLVTGSDSPLNPSDKYNAAKKQFESTLSAAEGGDTDAQGQLQNVSTAFLEASKVYNASSTQYVADFTEVQNGLTDMASAAKGQEDDAQRQLDLLDAQVTGLVTINNSVLSVAQAVQNLSAQMVAGGQAALPQASNTSLLTNAYQSVLGRNPDQAGGQYFSNQLSAGTSIDAITAALSSSAEAQIDKLYKADFGRTPDSDGLAWWIGQYNAGVSLAQIDQMMKTSPEYATLHGSHAGGLTSVPFDNYRANLHKGERVLTSQEAQSYSQNSSINAAMLDEMRGYRSDNKKWQDDQHNQTVALIQGYSQASMQAADCVVKGQESAAAQTQYHARTKIGKK